MHAFPFLICLLRKRGLTVILWGHFWHSEGKIQYVLCACFQVVSVWLIKDEKAELCIKRYQLKNNAEVKALV